MSESEMKTSNEENLKEVLKYIEKSNDLSKMSAEQIEKLKEQISNDFNFEASIQKINLACPKKRVIYIDGKDSLLYDDGEFFVEDTVDSKKLRKKLSRKKAMELYIEYFVTYILNPIIEEKKLNTVTKQIIKEEEKQVKAKIDNEKNKTLIKKNKLEKKEEAEIEL